ncbi:MAG TPA: sensor histidine kinase [Bacteroidales bacterium]|nr:sensor histidine kinase [Bacteroidales bacterium]
MATRQLNWSSLFRTILLHILFWIFIVTYFAWGFGFNENPMRSFINASLFLPGFFLIVYSLLYVLIPRYLLKKRFLPFFIGLFIVWAICALYTSRAELALVDSQVFRGMTLSTGKNVLPFLHVSGIAVSIKLLLYWYQQREQTLEAEKQRTAAELQLLKAQLHPHFLFNTLNNLYSHTLEYSPESPKIVMKLSELLRFMIYESNTPKIPLEKEISLIQNYITLEKLRYGDRLDMSVMISGDVGKYQIAPFMLLPFMENAFKHGTSKQLDQCWISLNLTMDGPVMYFKLVNSIELGDAEQQTKTGGLGLANAKKRLELLYKDKYVFEPKRLEDVFVVDLRVTLEKLEDQYAEMEMPYRG